MIYFFHISFIHITAMLKYQMQGGVQNAKSGKTKQYQRYIYSKKLKGH
jgi:hypothetical protein